MKWVTLLMSSSTLEALDCASIDGSFLKNAYSPQALEIPRANSSALVVASLAANPLIISQKERIFATAAGLRP